MITRNVADGAEVTHFKITSITNGTLYLNDGTTPIADGTFLTFAQANAGLRFTPALNFVGTASFSVQASTGNTDGDLGGATVTADITVNAVADTPSVTNATTTEDTQTSSGLVITRNVGDGAEVTHFKITSIVNGTLFQNDGTTPIADGTFITFAQGERRAEVHARRSTSSAPASFARAGGDRQYRRRPRRRHGHGRHHGQRRGRHAVGHQRDDERGHADVERAGDQPQRRPTAPRSRTSRSRASPTARCSRTTARRRSPTAPSSRSRRRTPG